MPLLTIVTINRNNACGLEQTLRSVAEQTLLGRVQMVVVDGASVDRSPDVIARWAGPLDATVLAERDAGIYDAMNKGLAIATGRYTLFLNSGDYLADARVVEDFSKYIARRGDSPSIVMGQIRRAGRTGTQAEKPYSFVRHLLGLAMHRHPASFVPTALAQALGGYSQAYGFAGDYDFMLRVSFAVGIDEWSRLCTVFSDDGISSRNLSQVPGLLSQVRRDRLQPTGWISALMTAYDRVFEHRHRRARRKAKDHRG